MFVIKVAMMAAQQCHNIENYWSADQQFFPKKEFEITSPRHLHNALKKLKNSIISRLPHIPYPRK